MTYTVEQAQSDFGKLLKDAEAGQEVVIERDGKPLARLSIVAEAENPKAKRIAGRYAGKHNYSDDIFKPLETDEELREYGFDILTDGNEPSEPAA
jgi:antitoxin (DNA-binding transcriptional repressor) of toxin-antitoxin stability system